MPQSVIGVIVLVSKHVSECPLVHYAGGLNSKDAAVLRGFRSRSVELASQRVLAVTQQGAKAMAELERAGIPDHLCVWHVACITSQTGYVGSSECTHAG